MARLIHTYLYLIQHLAGRNKVTITCPTAGCTDCHRISCATAKHAVLSGFMDLFAHNGSMSVQNWLSDQHC